MIFFQHYFFLVPFVVGFLAEALKFLIKRIRHKKDRFLFSPGGMPSGHSAFVGSLLVTVGHQEGWGSTLFLVTLVFSLIVMYDALTLRYQAGKHAKVINKHHPAAQLRESLGHTFWEVLAGVAFGGGVGGVLLFI